MRYDVDADVYEGPLGLMVELAKHRLLDMFLVQLQDLTAQYREWMKTDGLTLNELAEPLPLLGQLLAVKARSLLPLPPVVEEEEEAIGLEELERRLREYEQFKSVAKVLAELHALQHEHLTRLGHPEQAGWQAQSAAERSPIPGSVGILDLMSAFAKVFEKARAPSYEIQEELWTVEQKVQDLRVLLAVKKRLSFQELFSSDKTTLELVVTFLALLELVRQRACLAVQERAFGDIVIVRQESG